MYFSEAKRETAEINVTHTGKGKEVELMERWEGGSGTLPALTAGVGASKAHTAEAGTGTGGRLQAN